ncbi:MAG: hypothetical protein J2O48_04710 [Solirubrobacterales bacterium]|nr:hypothetical protein [Solirubrobacterales bacterium]
MSWVPRAVAVAALAAGISACGSSSSSTSSSAAPAGPAKSGPGVGKPAITIGDKNFSEEYILGDLYQQALEAKGYKVNLKQSIGASEIIYKALKGGQIQMYPEYTGTLLTAIAGDNKPPNSAAQTYKLADNYVKKNGMELLAQTPFYDADGLAVNKAYAKQHNLKTYSDLKKLGKVSIGGPAENRTRYDGMVGLQKVYGLTNLQFQPIAEGLTYKALDSGQIKIATIFTTDPQLKSGKYAVLSDSKKLFGFQNVAPVVKASVAKKEGPAFTQTINKVSKLLTLQAIIKMNAAVAENQQSPAVVAADFLKANGLAK